MVTSVDERGTLSSRPATLQEFEEGADAVALRIVTDRIEWWASPNKAAQVIEVVKAKATSSQPDMGDSGTIDV